MPTDLLFFDRPRFEQYLLELSTETAATIKAGPNPSAQSGSGIGTTRATPPAPGPQLRGNGQKKKRDPSCEPSIQEIRIEKIKYLLSLFSIANRYDFSQVRQYAIRAIEKLRVESGSGLDSVWSAVDRIELADRFDVDEWLVPAYQELCTRATMLTVQEGERIGGRKAAIIATVREMVLRQNFNNRGYGYVNVALDIKSVQTVLQNTLASLNSTPVA